MRTSLAQRQRELYQQDPVTMLTMVAPHLVHKLTDKLVRTRVALAEDPQCPEVVLELLTYDTDNVVMAVVQNPRCTLTALRTAAEFRLGYGSWSSDRILSHICDHPAFDLDLLRRFATDHPHLVVNDPRCPQDILVALAEHHDPYLRLCALGHKSMPNDALLRGIGDPDPLVTAAVRHVVSQRGYDIIRQALPLMCASDRQQTIQTLSSENIHRLATEADERIRYAVARVTDESTLLRHLASDPHGRVRRAASERVFKILAA